MSNPQRKRKLASRWFTRQHKKANERAERVARFCSLTSMVDGPVSVEGEYYLRRLELLQVAASRDKLFEDVDRLVTAARSRV